MKREIRLRYYWIRQNGARYAVKVRIDRPKFRRWAHNDGARREADERAIAFRRVSDDDPKIRGQAVLQYCNHRLGRIRLPAVRFEQQIYWLLANDIPDKLCHISGIGIINGRFSSKAIREVNEQPPAREGLNIANHLLA